MKNISHHSLPICVIAVTLTLTVCTFCKNLYLNDVVVLCVLMQCRPCLMSMKLQDYFNVQSCVAARALRILFLALGRKKSLCTTALDKMLCENIRKVCLVNPNNVRRIFSALPTKKTTRHRQLTCCRHTTSSLSITPYLTHKYAHRE